MTNHMNGMKEKPAQQKDISRVATQAENKVDTLTAQAKDQAAELAHQAQEGATNKLTEQKANAAAQLQDIANAIHQTGDQISQQNPTLAHYTRKLADQMESASSYLSDQELKEIMHDVQDFAHQRPEVFIGGAFALGVVIARFLKSSHTPQYPTTAEQSNRSRLPTQSPSYTAYRTGGSQTRPSRENMRDYSS